MSPFLYLWFAATVFSLATGRWIVVASLCWVVATVCDFLLVAFVITRSVSAKQLPNVDLFLLPGILVVTVTLAMLWVGSRRAARAIWWTCTFFAGAWICLLVWRWTQMDVGESRALLGPMLAITVHILTAFAIDRMLPRRHDPAYARAFE